MNRILILLVTLLFVSFSAVAQVQRTGRPVQAGPPPPQKANVVSLADPMNDFAKKGLPAAHTFGGMPDAALAKNAAALILKNDANSLPALIGALQVAGFHIIDSNQKILFKPSRANGVAFFDYEVAGMLRSTFFGTATTLDKLGSTISQGSTTLTKYDLGALMLADLTAGRTSKDSQNKFLATLVYELNPSGLSSTGSNLNLIQSSIIERRLFADIVIAYEEMSGLQSIYSPKEDSIDRGVMFVNASYRNYGQIGRRGFVADDGCPNIDTMEEAQGYKGKAEKIGKFFGYEHPGATAWSEILENSGILKDAVNGIEKANTIMSYLKVIMASMFIEASVDVPNAPLERTKSNQFIDRGQERIITAKFSIYFPNSQQINCAAKAAKLVTGIEMEVPKDGPMKDVPVKWEPLDRAEKAPLYIDSLDGKNVYSQQTDDKGENKIKATGKEQRRDLKIIPVSPVRKNDRWRVSIATEKMDAGTDIPKILFGSLSLKGGGIAGFLIGFVPEIMSKMAMKSFRVDIPVKDWEPCSDDWAGEIGYSKELHTTVVVRASRSSNGNSTGDGVREINNKESAMIRLNPRTKEEVAAKAPEKLADYYVEGRRSDKFRGKREADPCCGPEEGNFSTTFTSGKETEFTANFQGPFGISFSGGDMDFRLGFTFDTQSINANIHDFLHVEGTNCPLEEQESYDKNFEGRAMLSDALLEGRNGTRYLEPSGDYLVGSKSVPDLDGSTITWAWDLSRCKTPGK